ncbi:PIR protein [Plasmodium yoelii]|uniref:YIR protein n=1 Tax=Plasmodium yoelii TaxID=5861 RepID=A0A077Y4Z4_PLAYE|nr:PIR protein [Plasmodium yoelii]CDU17791.1 YIR protein [Plasmodium yoelii]VTZ78208.1 PIR protein [Plasmodium yoelii]|eukprot:XP_022812097.1 PIR protein [Plasmodium yoelii]
MTINNCHNFTNFWKLFPDELKKSKYDFRSYIFNKYCPNNNCVADTDIVNAGCLWLFNIFFGTGGISLYLDTYKNAVLCIMIWLSYKLNQKTGNGIIKLNDFYSNHIENNTQYTDNKLRHEKFKSYKEIIDTIKEYMDIDINEISKFYELLKLLCNMDTAYKSTNSIDFSEHVKKFGEEYEKLLNDDNNTDNSLYNKILHVLYNYYNNFEEYRAFIKKEMIRPPLSTEKTSKKGDVDVSNITKTTELSSETGKQNIPTITLSSNTELSGSSLVSKLIPVLSIFVAIAIFLGISYKYSLFGFRKRSQKQNLREKLKK